MSYKDAAAHMAALFKKLRKERGISLRQLADEAGVNSSVASRAERGMNARLSTWHRLFEGLGYRLSWEVIELAEEIPDLQAEEAERRLKKRQQGLCAGRWRFY